VATTAKPAPRRRMSAAERREVIVQAATEVFAEHGYSGASIDEIARRSGVSAPVVYDHFESKADLHRSLVEGQCADLQQVWHDSLSGDEPRDQRIARAFDGWFAYVEAHPNAWRMLFLDTSGGPEVEEIRRDVAAQSREAMLPLLARERSSTRLGKPGAKDTLDMVWEVFNAVLQGLALWWYHNQHVPRERVVASAMNALWVGFERVGEGEVWRP
jgi:AcrR family transcriptional regulator